MDFVGSNILSVNQFERQDLEQLFKVADTMRPYAQREKATRVLEGAILGNIFLEPSTRTRLSFGCAFDLLGGSVRETVGAAASALVKGESLYDTAWVLSGYSDVICIRHPQAGSVAEFAAASRVPVINGGDGANEHPTQALLDLYTIRKELARHDRSVDTLRIAMIGDLKYGRTVHSLCKLLCLFNKIHIVLVSPPELAMPLELIAQLREAGHTVKISEQLETAIAHVDIAYFTRVQEERFSSQQEANRFRGRLRLNRAVFTRYAEPNTVIMHPLPRDSRAEANELDPDLNGHPNLAIFRQTDNGLLVRMALFAMLLGVEGKIERHTYPVGWHSRRNLN
ncbi:MAG: aspartate carbamoyltransferase [Gammaproteobacteria bacterium]|nr:aspartate carbamoyltransferase [Gammaproteobacteria bacterium]